MKFRFLGILLVILIFAVCCESTPETRSNETSVSGASSSAFSSTADGTPAYSAAPSSSENTSGPRRVSQQEYTSTMQDVRVFIDELNGIMAARNYRAWRERLSPDYLARISSREYLAEVSEMPAMKTRRIVLRSAEEYFIHVVVPSRQNSRVDDIEFFGESRVIAYTINKNRAGEDVRLRMYDLERKGNSWIIIN